MAGRDSNPPFPGEYRAWRMHRKDLYRRTTNPEIPIDLPTYESETRMRATDPMMTVLGTNLGESAKAVKFRIDTIDGEPLLEAKTEWFPFGQISKTFKDPVNEGTDYLVVSEWILKQKGLVK